MPANPPGVGVTGASPAGRFRALPRLSTRETRTGDIVVYTLLKCYTLTVDAGGMPLLEGFVRGFDGEYRFLSNFSPSEVTLDGETYPTVEHAFQAAKTFDLEEREQVRRAPTPAAAKKLGRRVTLRRDWQTVKIGIMKDLVREKFQKPELAEKLLATGDDVLIEENWWNDQFWGVSKGRGKNHLGRILMEVRTELRTVVVRQ